MRIGRERVEEVPHLLADQGVMDDLGHEPIELLARRQLAPDEEVRDLQEGGVLRELFDRIAAVAEDAVFPVEVGDRARAGAGVAIAGIERDPPGLRSQGADVERVVALGARDDRQLDVTVADAQRWRRWRCRCSRQELLDGGPLLEQLGGGRLDPLAREVVMRDALDDLDAVRVRPQRIAEDEALGTP